MINLKKHFHYCFDNLYLQILLSRKKGVSEVYISLTLFIELSSFPFIDCFKLKGFAPSLSTNIPSFFCLDFRIKIECEEMCVYTFQLEPVFVFISLKLVKDYIFLIENSFTMIQKN